MMKRRSDFRFSKASLFSVVIAVTTLLSGVLPVSAQDGVGIFQRSRNQPPNFPQASQDLGTPTYVPVDDEDLGMILLLQERQKYSPFSLAISSGLYYTDNAFLTETNTIEDAYWWNSLGLSYKPQLFGSLAADFTFGYDLVRYESNSELDYDEMEVGAGLLYILRDLGDLSLFGRYQYDRLMEPRDYSEIFVQHEIAVGFYKPFIINQNQFLYLRMSAEFGLDANPDPAKQNDYSGILGYRLTVLDDISVEPYYRARFLDFDGGREDLSHQVGLAINCRLGDSWYLGATGYYLTNDSNRADGDFEAGTIGGQIGFQKRF